MSQERSTRQRAAMRATIEAAARPLSPQEICAMAQSDAPGLGMATVYRNLKLMVEAGEIEPVVLPGEGARYESTHHGHHHHFQCNECKRVFDVYECPGDLDRLAPKGFTVERHELTLYGRCDECAIPKRAGEASVLPKEG
jgi:Fur family ferric uptake transcriptional regulator